MLDLTEFALIGVNFFRTTLFYKTQTTTNYLHFEPKKAHEARESFYQVQNHG